MRGSRPVGPPYGTAPRRPGGPPTGLASQPPTCMRLTLSAGPALERPRPARRPACRPSPGPRRLRPVDRVKSRLLRFAQLSAQLFVQDAQLGHIERTDRDRHLRSAIRHRRTVQVPQSDQHSLAGRVRAVYGRAPPRRASKASPPPCRAVRPSHASRAATEPTVNDAG